MEMNKNKIIITIHQLEERLRVGVDTIVLDVRTRDEILTGVIPGAKHVVREDLILWVQQNVEDTRAPIVLYCESGIRSASAANQLLDLGYECVASLEGGLRNWLKLNLSLESVDCLEKEKFDRYARQMQLPEIGIEGQKKILNSKVLVVGAGGLGSPCLTYLAAAGVGCIGIADYDRIEASNLHRQILYKESDIGKLKAVSAGLSIKQINSQIVTNIYQEKIDVQNACFIFSEYDIVVDCVDDFSTRYVISDAAVKCRIPVVHGAVHRFEGVVGVLNNQGGACYRCIYPDTPPPDLAPNCADNGVLGVVPGVIGIFQASEVLKLIVDSDADNKQCLTRYNAQNFTLQQLTIEVRKGCTCQDNNNLE